MLVSSPWPSSFHVPSIRIMMRFIANSSEEEGSKLDARLTSQAKRSSCTCCYFTSLRVLRCILPHPWPAVPRLSSSGPPSPFSAPPADRPRSSAGRRRCSSNPRSAGSRRRASADGQAEFCDGLLQEIDIALQTTGPPFHGLLDGADFDAGNILCAGVRRCQHAERQQTTDATTRDPADHRNLHVSSAHRGQFVASQMPTSKISY